MTMKECKKCNGDGYSYEDGRQTPTRCECQNSHCISSTGSDVAREWINANVWDGEDRRGAVNDRATFTPDELQELVDDLLAHLQQNAETRRP